MEETAASESAEQHQLHRPLSHRVAVRRFVRCARSAEKGQIPEINGQIPAKRRRQRNAVDAQRARRDAVQRLDVLRSFSIINSVLRGSVAFNKLPRSLETLNLYNNQMTGIVDFAECPPKIRKIYLERNQFTEIVHPEQLPRRLTVLFLGVNRFGSEVNRTMFSSVDALHFYI